MTEVRCGNCGHWIGEAPDDLVLVEHVKRSSDTKVGPPRDLRICASCNRVNVFIARASLDGMLGVPVG